MSSTGPCAKSRYSVVAEYAASDFSSATRNASACQSSDPDNSVSEVVRWAPSRRPAPSGEDPLALILGRAAWLSALTGSTIAFEPEAGWEGFTKSHTVKRRALTNRMR